MRIKLPDYLSLKIILLAVFLLGAAIQGNAQTTLNPGDLVVVSVNADNNSFDFIPLVDLQSNTKVYFSDNAYVASKGELNDNEGTLTYTASSKIPAGTVVHYDGSDKNGFVQTDGDYNAAGGGDNLLVYQVDADTTYLYGVGWAKGSSVWDYSSNPSSNKSDIPPGLSETDNTILSLGTTDNYQYDAANGREGTQDYLLNEVGDANHWKESTEAFNKFTSSFNLLNPPTVAFSTPSISKEEGTTVNIPVKLVETNGTAVSVEVAFVGNSSSADVSDFNGGYTTKTVTFSSSETVGTTKDIPLTLNDDGTFEGTEKAVFKLQNNSAGTIIDPGIITLTLKDSDAPKVVINEFLADPADQDVNKDGAEGTRDDEFVEIVNNESSDIDISNWTLSDQNRTQYTFPAGTVISASRALVVFGGGYPSGSFGGARVVIADGLSLKNRDDAIILKDANGNQVDRVDYGSTTSGVSLNRNPDVSGTLFSDHNAIDQADGNFSPGTKVDGSPFGSKHAVGIRGNQGWRMITSPVQGATFDEFFNKFWMQGVSGSDDPGGDPTIAYWDESTASFKIPTNMNNNITAGKGYIVYFFKDDEYNEPGVQGGFPKIIDSNRDENRGSVSVSVSATDSDNSGAIDGDEGWNLLGNPFDTNISVTKLKNALEKASSDLDAEIYIWDYSKGDGNGGYKTLTDGDFIAPFEAFFVRYNSGIVSSNVDLNRSALEANQGKKFYKQSDETAFKFSLELHGDKYFDTYYLEFGDQGSPDLNKYDAYKLFSLNPGSISLYSMLQKNKLQKKTLPRDLESTFEIPLAFEASGRTSLTFKWNDIESLPNDWDVFLIDKEMNRKIDLNSNKEYSFNVNGDPAKLKASNDEKLLNQAKEKANSSRFVLSIQPKPKQKSTNDLPESVKLNPNYPNPFNPTTKISYEITKKSKVTLTVWNMIGQKVATLVDGVVDAGTHEETWNASDMPSGIYIARFQVEGNVFTRKMTLIK